MSEQTPVQEGASEDPVLLRREGHLAHIILNRPKAINALTHEMVGVIHEALDAWAEDDSVETVLLTGAGERGLCAGGDIVALWNDAREGTGEDAATFWRDEYLLNAAIGRYPKPYVAVMDGIVLGGGIGLSAHGSMRIVTERSKIGMPETGIGFLPDVGGTFLLSHAPGELGTHLALTAGSVGPGDAIEVGMADYYVPTERIPRLIELLATESAKDAVAAVAEAAPESPLAADRAWIDEAYQGDDVAAILARLQGNDAEGPQRAAKAISGKSPTSLTVTLHALRAARDFETLEEALAQELRVAIRLHEAHDFVEGVRAQVIDKDRNPQWQPATLEDVTDVDSFFAPLGDREFPTTPPTT